jgi:DNA replication protein DnaC
MMGLLTDFSVAYERGEAHKFIAQLAKFNLIIFDEWLRDNFQLEQSRFVLDLIDSRFRHRSCLFVSQLPVEKWHSRLGEPTIADAILDRIIHDSFKINLEGDSMRKITSNLVDHLYQKE